MCSVIWNAIRIEPFKLDGLFDNLLHESLVVEDDFLYRICSYISAHGLNRIMIVSDLALTKVKSGSVQIQMGQEVERSCQ